MVPHRSHILSIIKIIGLHFCPSLYNSNTKYLNIFIPLGVFEKSENFNGLTKMT